jgi:two-component system, chemotaxis family, protein-glutamate methylesterase/glutaminase
VVAAEDGTRLEPGRVHVAVPDHHLMVTDGHLAVTHGPTENRHRPSINALFRSVALHASAHGVGVLLSGTLDDGVSGLASIHARGGVVVAQDPDDASFPGLPRAAIERTAVDHVVPALQVGRLLADLATREIKEKSMPRDPILETENRIAMGGAFARPQDSENIGPPTNFVCPDCNGGLMKIDEGNFRCRIGHAWTADALIGARSDEIDNALGMAVRSLQEKAELADSLADKVSTGALKDRYLRTARDSRNAAEVLRDRLFELLPHTEDESPAPTGV